MLHINPAYCVPNIIKNQSAFVETSHIKGGHFLDHSISLLKCVVDLLLYLNLSSTGHAKDGQIEQRNENANAAII